MVAHCTPQEDETAGVPTIPDGQLFQGVVEVLCKGKEPFTQEWARRYMCVWCNPPCIALFVSEMAAKSQPEAYIWLPPGSEWHGACPLAFRFLFLFVSCFCFLFGGKCAQRV